MSCLKSPNKIIYSYPFQTFLQRSQQRQNGALVWVVRRDQDNYGRIATVEHLLNMVKALGSVLKHQKLRN